MFEVERDFDGRASVAAPRGRDAERRADTSSLTASFQRVRRKGLHHPGRDAPGSSTRRAGFRTAKSALGSPIRSPRPRAISSCVRSISSSRRDARLAQSLAQGSGAAPLVPPPARLTRRSYDPSRGARIRLRSRPVRRIDAAARGALACAHPMQVASLDHALWLHEPFRFDDWLLYAIDSPWSGHARGLIADRSSRATGA